MLLKPELPSPIPSEGQEKYLQELSITPKYFTGAIKNHSRAVRYFRGTGMIFPRLALLM
jgi:hypothetical protein